MDNRRTERLLHASLVCTGSTLRSTYEIVCSGFKSRHTLKAGGPQVSTLTSNYPSLLPLHDPFSSNPSAMLEASVFILFILCATSSAAAMVRLPHSLSMYIRLTARHLR